MRLLPWGAGEKLAQERALNLTLVEMYVRGVSTRKVKAVIEQLCGASVSSKQVSRASGQLDEVLQGWRNRPLGVIFDRTWTPGMRRCAWMVKSGM